jgi:hypothetical protein
MVKEIVITLLGGLLIPILLETWRNRNTKPVATPAGEAPGAGGPASSGLQGGSIKRILERLFFAGLIGLPLGLIAASVIEFGELDWGLISTDLDEFSSTDTVVSVVSIILIWILLSKFGPLKTKSAQT